MLLQQKCYVEGGQMLAFDAAVLVDRQHDPDATVREQSHLLLELLTPIVKAWNSDYALRANDLAIQVLGGYGYTRDYPVEQYWRDNRLNMIHEGTHGIQALDLLGRKVVMDGGKGLKLLANKLNATIQRALMLPALAEHANALAGTLKALGNATQAAWASGVPEEALANATPYLQAFGHTVLAWVWLDVAICAQEHLEQATAAGQGDTALLHGKLAAARFFLRYELPKVPAWLKVVETRDDTCRSMNDAWF
jgi:butyryl-CoA dehydrogenase